jgi:hypothetical protein
MLSCSSLSVGLSSPTRRYAAGARNSARVSPIACEAVGHDRGQVASRRGIYPAPGRAALSLACRRSGWRCAQHPCSAPAQFKCRETVAQAIAERSRVRAAGDRDQQVAKLRRCAASTASRRRASEKPISEYRAENSHRPTRRRERQMQRFKSSEQAQAFLSAHPFIYGHFHPRRHQLAAHTYRTIRSDAFKIWHQETCAQCTG